MQGFSSQVGAMLILFRENTQNSQYGFTRHIGQLFRGSAQGCFGSPGTAYGAGAAAIDRSSPNIS
jgi:hypothetical protein